MPARIALYKREMLFRVRLNARRLLRAGKGGARHLMERCPGVKTRPDYAGSSIAERFAEKLPK